MQRFEDVLTGIMLIGSTVIVLGIASMGAFFFLRGSNLIPLTVIFAVGVLLLYTIRCIAIGLSIIFHGRYQDDMTRKDNRRYTD